MNNHTAKRVAAFTLSLMLAAAPLAALGEPTEPGIKSAILRITAAHDASPAIKTLSRWKSLI